MTNPITEKILAQIPGDTIGGLHRADRLWQSLKENQIPVKPAIAESQEPLGENQWDAIVCGGTLGIFIGAALALRGWRIALLERGNLRGRDQEWNISRPELNVFLDLDLLSEEQIEQAIATEYNPARIQFTGGPAFWVRDVLNIGVDPVYLLDTLKARFLQAGGQLFEQTSFDSAVVHPDGVLVKTTNEDAFKTRLLLDVMGHFSPIVRQARQGKKPDGVCLVVGSCAKGFPKNETGDLIVSFTEIEKQCQYFWEAFPARDGRTTYLFTYLDADPKRLSLTELFEDYLRLLPEYQNVELSQLEFVRALFGFFPAYRESPLRSPWNRIFFVGDSSGMQSPLSFGGFGAMLRHLKRLADGIDDALKKEMLSREALELLQPYQPNLAVTWLFQKAMSVEVDREIDPEKKNQINELLSGVFQEMDELGEPILKPFLQDVVQFGGLSQTLVKTAIAQPQKVMRVIPQVGVASLLDWMQHYLNLGLYSALAPIGQAMEPTANRLPRTPQYYCRRWIQAWHYGSGGDYGE
ncbi:NAD(P)/FAD-dependent oxidoreductase [Phormidium sp. CCY1219]|uniref:NAD(P)/FAD-dependent oxidoreductase n=1 Tax=Phormidium sp. CCY1219 TaxID=2886104 RepID=UPI002D1E8DDE|nr:FAD-binding oxidoreductase [Phormidium sp. CCY1219]MEB3827665.1 FAD-binding oxidoreductase [Phormidium sp. CCY1219]